MASLAHHPTTAPPHDRNTMISSPEFLVSHGVTAALTRCRATALAPRRGDRVVFRGPRGEEIGEVLCPAPALADAISAGELLRSVTRDDETRAETWRRRGLALLDDVQSRIAAQSLPLLALDVEIPLDGGRAFVHVLRWEPCSLTPLVESLFAAHGIPISFQDRGDQEQDLDHDHGCGSCGTGGCGEGGCSTGGCGSGSCSSGTVKSADEMTAYFAALREQMMHAQARVPLGSS